MCLWGVVGKDGNLAGFQARQKVLGHTRIFTRAGLVAIYKTIHAGADGAVQLVARKLYGGSSSDRKVGVVLSMLVVPSNSK